MRMTAPHSWPQMLAAERIVLAVTLALAIVGTFVVLYRGYTLDWTAYAGLLGAGLTLISVGYAYRTSGRSQSLGDTLIATGCYVAFSNVASVFNYLLLPIWHAPIDPALAAMDATVGFRWLDVMQAVAGSSLLIEATRYAYMSSLFQFAIIVLVLGLGGRTRELHVFMVATTLATLMTIGFWAVFPSLGTTSIFPLPDELERTIQPLLGNQYGSKMLRLSQVGPSHISPADIQGLISAPSFHAVMALLAVHAVRTLRWALPAFAVLNSLVLIGSVIHGAHHLTDIALGAVVTAAALALAHTLLSSDAQLAIAPVRDPLHPTSA